MIEFPNYYGIILSLSFTTAKQKQMWLGSVCHNSKDFDKLFREFLWNNYVDQSQLTINRTFKMWLKLIYFETMKVLLNKTD